MLQVLVDPGVVHSIRDILAHRDGGTILQRDLVQIEEVFVTFVGVSGGIEGAPIGCRERVGVLAADIIREAIRIVLVHHGNSPSSPAWAARRPAMTRSGRVVWPSPG